MLCAAAHGAATKHGTAAAHGPSRPLRVAVLDFGERDTGRRASKDFATHLLKTGGVEMVDESQARAAARGVGYAGSLNMTVEQARDLGAAIGCDFYVTGDAQTLRRSSSSVPVYYEAYASVFLISARTGRLVNWARARAEAATPEEAERLLALKSPGLAASCRDAMKEEATLEVARREREMTAEVLEMEELPEEDTPAAKGFRPPHPYRRVRPPYTDSALQAEAEATVDASVEVNERGEVLRAEIVRWAGFGLDESVLATVSALRFRPATRDGAPVPVRVLLRYNFRRPRPTSQQEAEPERRLGPAFKELLRTHKQP